MFTRKQIQADRCICLVGYGCDRVTLSEETERNGEDKPQPVATTPVFYSTTRKSSLFPNHVLM
ncbi:MAG: hypothetical protein DWB56_05780 [Candidatus Jettenia sp.]|nr:hypothetical protein [Candidatus Jettenia sp.]